MAHPLGPTRRSVVTGGLTALSSLALLSACGGSTNGADHAGGTSGGSSGTGGAGATGAGGAGAGGAGANGAGAAGGEGGAGDGACTLYPQQTEGPFYLADELVREDITEGKAGLPLSLAIEVRSASGCAPLSGVTVDVWQCDAEGVYSGYPGQLGGLDTTGQTFLRGTQLTGDDGVARFTTIYPGWYPGRTTHLHFKIHPSSSSEATSQLYFPEAVTELVYAAAPYAARGQKDTSNADDSVARGTTPLAVLTETDGGYAARLTVTVAG